MDFTHLIIGCGSIGSRHGRNLLALGQANILWFDTDHPVAQKNAAEIGGRAVEEWQAALGPEVCVYVCVPPRHAAGIAAGAGANCAALFMEKPIAADLAGARQVARALAKNQRPHLVACNYRFDPGLLAMKTALDAGQIGRPVFLQMEYGNYLPNFRPGRDFRQTYSATAAEGGGVINDRIHEFDFLHWLFGREAELAAFRPENRVLPISSEEVVSLVGACANGASFELHLDYLSRQYRCRRRLVGETGEINWDYAAGVCTLTDYASGQSRELFQAAGFDVNHMYMEEMRHFLQVARGQAQTVCDAAEGARILATALKAKAALAAGAKEHAKPRGRTVALVQARLRSTRLPAKALASLAGRPSLAWVLLRASQAAMVDQVVLATGDDPANDPLAELAKSQGFQVFRGDEDDVLKRFSQAARQYRAQVVVRLTGDCPLIDPGLLDEMLTRFHQGNMDYLSNAYPRASFPDGLDTEIFTAASLHQAHCQAGEPFQREHVTPYIWQNRRGDFRLETFANPEDLSGLRWTLDTAEDLDYLQDLMAGLDDPLAAGWRQALAVAENLPETQQRQARNQSFTAQMLENLKQGLGLDRPLCFDKSRDLFQRAKESVPGAAQTFSKGYTQFPQGSSPIFAEGAEGVVLTDVDGNQYLDMMMALGPILLGYANPLVDRAVWEFCRRASSFSLPHRLEVEVAERLKKHIACAEMVRFGQNGSDATAACVRVARAFTGREMVLACGYHGWQDWYIGATTRNAGVPKSTSELISLFPYNDLAALEEQLEKHKDQVALVIMEPTGVVAPQPGFLQGVRELATRHGALLAFDEVWTGFRFGLGGAQARFGVTPDISAFGKALGNGWPISLVCGRADVMKWFEETFFSFTFAGNLAGLGAAMKVLDILEGGPVIENMWRDSAPLSQGLNRLIAENGLADRVKIVGWPIKHLVQYLDENGQEDLALKSLAIQELVKRRVLAPGYHVISTAHEAHHLEFLLEVYGEVLPILAQAIQGGKVREMLTGLPVQPVFRQH